jgi:hypothetical protein
MDAPSQRMGESKPNEESVAPSESSTTEFQEESPTHFWFVIALLGVLLAQVVYGVLVFLLVGPQMAPRGQFGDIFGGINALFTGLAFAGVIYTILLQRKELDFQRKELGMQREELRANRAELSRSAQAQMDQVLTLKDSTDLSVLTALVNVYSKSLEPYYEMKKEYILQYEQSQTLGGDQSEKLRQREELERKLRQREDEWKDLITERLRLLRKLQQRAGLTSKTPPT